MTIKIQKNGENLEKKQSFFEKLKIKRVQDEFNQVNFFEFLSQEEKEEYLKQQLERRKFQIGSGILVLIILIFSIGYYSVIFDIDQIKTENFALYEEAENLKKQINGAKNLENKLQNVSLNGKIAEAIFNNRDETVFALETIEKLIPNDISNLDIKKIARISKNFYSIDFDLKINPNINKNEYIKKVAYLSIVFDRSNEILKETFSDGKERYFELVDFGGVNYSSSTNSFPISFKIRFISKEKNKERKK